MAELSLISWCHHTLNFWMGCDKVAPECAKCYIDRVIGRMDHEKYPQAFGRLYKTKKWSDALRWQNWCTAHDNVYLRVFTLSLSDFFHAGADPWRPDAWKIIKDCPNLIFLVLSKRPELIERRLPADWGEGYPNVWLGVSTGCRMTLNKMDTLRRIPCALRFLSAEPLLEDVTQCYYCANPDPGGVTYPAAVNGVHKGAFNPDHSYRCEGINLDGFGWVITGGESGSGPEYLWNPKGDWRQEFERGGRRTMKKEWAEALRFKALERGTPFLFKQKTAAQPGQGEDFLGKVYKDFPPPMPTGGTWAVKEAAA